MLKYTCKKKKNIPKITKMILVYLFAGLWRLWTLRLNCTYIYIDSLQLNNGRVKRIRCKLKIVNNLYLEMRINTVGNSFLNNFWFCFSFSHNYHQNWMLSEFELRATLIKFRFVTGVHHYLCYPEPRSSFVNYNPF